MTGLGAFSTTAMIEVTAVNRGGDVISGGTRTTVPDLSSYGGDGNGQIVASGSNAQSHEHPFPLTPS